MSHVVILVVFVRRANLSNVAENCSTLFCVTIAITQSNTFPDTLIHIVDEVRPVLVPNFISEEPLLISVVKPARIGVGSMVKLEVVAASSSHADNPAKKYVLTWPWKADVSNFSAICAASRTRFNQ